MESELDSFPDLRVDMPVVTNTPMFLEIVGEVSLRDLVSLLVFAIFFIPVLNSIVGEVHVSVFQVLQIVLIRRSSYVAFSIEVPSHVDAVDDLAEAKHPDVKLPHWRIEPMGTTN